LRVARRFAHPTLAAIATTDVPVTPLLFRLVLILATLGAPLAAQEVEAPSGTIATETDAQTDARVARRLREIMIALGGYEDVSVAVSEGIVSFRGTTTSADEAAELSALAGRIEGVVAIRNDVAETADLSRRLNPAVERFRTRMAQIVAFAPLLLIAFGVFAIITFAGYALSSWRRPWDRLAPNRFIAALYGQIVMILFVVVGIVAALDILNATALLGTILGAAGIVGLAFGFAVRDTVENYIASIMLSIRQPFRPNDTIEIDGDEGKVIRLTSRATILMSFDGNQIRIPNATVFKSRIVNYTQNAERRFLFTVGVDPNADLSAARTLAERAVQSLPYVLAEPASQAWLENITEGGVTITVAGWIDQRETNINLGRGEALRQVKVAIEAAGIELPDTTYRIRLDSGQGIVTEEAADGQAAEAPPVRHVDPPADKVAAVVSNTETSLDRIVAAERGAARNEDLLRSDAKTE